MNRLPFETKFLKRRLAVGEVLRGGKILIDGSLPKRSKQPMILIRLQHRRKRLSDPINKEQSAPAPIAEAEAVELLKSLGYTVTR